MDYIKAFAVAFVAVVHICSLAGWGSAQYLSNPEASRAGQPACAGDVSPPANLAVSFDGDDSLTARWDPSGFSHQYGYLVQWCWGSSCSEEHTIECGDEHDTRNIRFNIRDVQPFTYYTVSVSGYKMDPSRSKCMLGTAVVCMQTPRGNPRQVTDLRLKTVKNDSIRIEWTAPKTRNKIPVSYRITWDIDDGGCIGYGCQKSFSGTVEHTSFYVGNLVPLTNVCFNVTPFIEVLKSKVHGNQSALCVRTLPYDQTLVANEITATEIKLSWTGKTPNYTVQWCVRPGPCPGLYFDSDDCKVTNNITTETTFSWSGLRPWTSVLVRITPYSTLGIECFTTKVERPHSPRGLQVSNITSTSVIVSWTAPVIRNGPIDAYFISVVDEATRFTNASSEVSGKETRAIINGLDPWTNYVIAVGAVNLNASMSQLISSDRPSVKVKTLPGPPSPPRFLMTTVTSRTVRASWREPMKENGPRGTLWYKIVIKKDVPSDNDVIALETKDTFIEYDNLEPFTDYVINVSASNRYRGSVWESTGTQEEFRTSQEAPDAVEDLTANCDSEPNVIKLTWKPPRRSNGIIQGYDIKLIGKKKEKPTIHRTMSVGAGLSCQKKQCSFELHKVKAEYNYVITVRARNKGVSEFGAVKETEEVCVVPAGAPPPPEKRLILDASWTSNINQQRQITFGFWNDTFSDLGGDIISYDVLVSLHADIDRALPISGGRTRCSTWGKVHVYGFISCYVASPEYWNPFSDSGNDHAMDCDTNGTFVKCTLGVASDCDTFDDRCNGPLKSGTKYGMVLRAFTAAGFQDTEPVVFTTAKTDYSEFNHRVMLAGVMLVAVVLLAVIFGIFCYFFVNRKCCWEARKPAVMW